MWNELVSQIWLIISWITRFQHMIFWSKSDVSINVATTFLRTKLSINRLSLLLETRFLFNSSWIKSLENIQEIFTFKINNQEWGIKACYDVVPIFLRYLVWHLARTNVLKKSSQHMSTNPTWLIRVCQMDAVTVKNGEERLEVKEKYRKMKYYNEEHQHGLHS